MTSIHIKKIALNTLSGFIRQGVSFFVLFLLTPFIISKIGKESFGLWSLVISIISFFDLLDLGFSSAVVKYTAECNALQDRSKGNQFISTVFFIYLFLSGIGIVVFGLLSVFFENLFSIPSSELSQGFIVLLVMGFRFLFISFPFSIFRGILVGEQYIYLTNAISITSSLLYALFAWFSLSHGMGIVSLSVCYLIASIVENATYLFLAFHLTQNLKISWSFVKIQTFHELFSFSSAQFIANISSMILFSGDLIIIKLFSTLDMVAIYAIPLRITTFCYMLIKQYTNVLTPVIAHMHALKHKDKIQRLFIRGSKYVMAITTPICIGGIIFSHEIISLWVGQGFLLGENVLVILLLAMWLNMSYLITGDILQLCGYHRLFAIYFSSIITAHLVISISLIHNLGLNGVALGALAGSFIGFFTQFRKVMSLYEINYLYYAKMMIKTILLPSLSQGIILLMIKVFLPIISFWTLLWVNVLGVLAYTAVMWFFCLEKTDRDLLKTAVSGSWNKKEK